MQSKTENTLGAAGGGLAGSFVSGPASPIFAVVFFAIGVNDATFAMRLQEMYDNNNCGNRARVDELYEEDEDE